MPRSPRIEFSGARYHVMSRGNRREFLLEGDENRQLFMDTFEQACERCAWVVHAYVLMDNHFHLLLETPEPNLSDGMRWLQGTYGARYNRRHGLVGHVWQGRFKSPLISDEGDEHFLSVSRYIHLNPARAHLLDPANPRLKAYGWSSFPGIAGAPSKRPAWLDALTTLKVYELGMDDAASRRKYAQRMEYAARECIRGELDEEHEAERRALLRGWYIGEKTFRDRMLDHLDRAVSGRKADSLRSTAYKESLEQRAKEIIKRAGKSWVLSRKGIRALAKTDPRKQALVGLLRAQTPMTYKWIIEELNMGSKASVSLAINKVNVGDRTVLKAMRDLEAL